MKYRTDDEIAKLNSISAASTVVKNDFRTNSNNSLDPTDDYSKDAVKPATSATKVSLTLTFQKTKKQSDLEKAAKATNQTKLTFFTKK